MKHIVCISIGILLLLSSPRQALAGSCDAGYDDSSGACLPCLSGNFKAVLGTDACRTCPSGTYSPAGASTCTTCAVDYGSLPASGICCAANQYLTATRMGCLTCPSNSQSSPGALVCTPMPGYYNKDNKLLAYYNFPSPGDLYKDQTGNGFTLSPYNGPSKAPTYDSSTQPFSGAGSVYFNNQGAGFAGVTGVDARSLRANVPLTGLDIMGMAQESADSSPGFTYCYWMRAADGATSGLVNDIANQIYMGFFSDATVDPLHAIWNKRNTDVADKSTIHLDVFVDGSSRYKVPFVSTRSENIGGYKRTWTHICHVLFAGNNLKTYINCGGSTCVPSGSMTLAFNAYVSSPISFHRYVIFGQGKANNAFFGWLSEIRMYRRALTASDVFGVRSYTGTGAVPLAPISCSKSCSAGQTLRCTSYGVGLCCRAGEYFIEGVTSRCEMCPFGTYSLAGASTACDKCTSNTFATTSSVSSSCTACSASAGLSAGVCVRGKLIFTLDTRECTRAGPDGFFPYIVPMDSELGTVSVSDGTLTTVGGAILPRGMQLWTVKRTGVYEILAAGAGQMDFTISGFAAVAGKGAVVKTTKNLNAGDQLIIAVGAKPLSRYAGCGGTFVSQFAADGSGFSTAASHTPVLIAGGGGGIVDLASTCAIQANVYKCRGMDATFTTLATVFSCRSVSTGYLPTGGGGGGHVIKQVG